MKKDRLHRLIEQELFRRASLMVEARRIALAEHLLTEKEVSEKFKVKLAIRNLIQQAEDAGDEGDSDAADKYMDRAEELAKKYGFDLGEIKAKVKPNAKKKKPEPEPKPDIDDEDDDSGDDETDTDLKKPEPKDGPEKDKAPEPGGVAAKVDDDDDEERGSVGGSSSAGRNEPPMPEDGTADDDIKNGKVTYDIQGKKLGEKETKAIPQSWFEKWLEREKYAAAELKDKLARTQQTSRELTPPRTQDRDRQNHFREVQAGYQNKIKAIQKVLTSLQKKDNKDIDDHNKKQDRRKEHINNIVDVLSGGNPLLKTIVGLMADKLLKNKDKVNYTGGDDPYGDDY